MADDLFVALGRNRFAGENAIQKWPHLGRRGRPAKPDQHDGFANARYRGYILTAHVTDSLARLRCAPPGVLTADVAGSLLFGLPPSYIGLADLARRPG